MKDDVKVVIAMEFLHDLNGVIIMGTTMETKGIVMNLREDLIAVEML